MKITTLINRLRGYVIAVTLFWGCAQLFSQQRLVQPKMSVGVHGGVMVSTVLFNPEVIAYEHLVDRFILGGNGGFVFRYLGNKICGFEIELNYLQRGWREKGSDSVGNVNYRRFLHYVELPFLTHIYIGGERANFIFNLGPQIGWCFGDQAKGKQQTIITNQYEAISHRFDWGVVGGLGFLYNTSRKNSFVFELRFSYSFGYLYENRVTSFFSASNPITISANIGWLWSIGKKKSRRASQELKI